MAFCPPLPCLNSARLPHTQPQIFFFGGGRGQKRPVGSYGGGQTPPPLSRAQHPHSYSLPKPHPLPVLSQGMVPPPPSRGHCELGGGAQGGWGSPGTVQLRPLVVSCLSFPRGKRTPSRGSTWVGTPRAGGVGGGCHTQLDPHKLWWTQASQFTPPSGCKHPSPPWGPPFYLYLSVPLCTFCPPHPVTPSQVAITPPSPPAHVRSAL